MLAPHYYEDYYILALQSVMCVCVCVIHELSHIEIANTIRDVAIRGVADRTQRSAIQLSNNVDAVES